MAHVYIVDNVHGDRSYYLNTSREADRCRPGGEHPDRITCVDGAAECTRLLAKVEEQEATINTIRWLLEELYDVYPADLLEDTELGRKLAKLIKDNPLSPATSAERDGQRSYGTG